MVLKEIQYKNLGGPEFGYAKVVYTIFLGNQCVFSGITPGPGRTSTINAAETIIAAIAQQEGCEVDEFRFYDLQTKSGYEQKKPGEYEFDALRIEDGHVEGWQSTECPEHVLEAFRQYII